MPSRSITLFVLALIAAAGPALAQSPASPLAGCGTTDPGFHTTFGEAGDKTPPEAPDKATVYVIAIRNSSDTGRAGRPAVRFGLDGTWIGQTKGLSFLRFPADPGTHHACASWQSMLNGGQTQFSLLNFNVEAGKTYYLRLKINIDGAQSLGSGSIDLEPVSTDEGRYLVSIAPRIISRPK